MSLSQLYAPIAEDMKALDAVIRDRLYSDVVLIRQVAEYIIGSGGKRLRPALLILAARALGCQGPAVHEQAAMIECIHTATLLHDDVVDESDKRRGRDTANAMFGNAASVLVGDFLYTRAFQMMVHTHSLRVLEIMAEATNIIAEGEVMQLLNIGNADVDEAAYLAVIERKTAVLFGAAQDHKRAYDGDKGPNTGGMGSYSPVPQLSQAEYQEIVDQLVEPTAKGLLAGGYDYHGVLYLGLMMTKQGPKMIEYNVRLGDPETEVVLPRLKSDFAELVAACINDEEMPAVEEKDEAVLGVILAAEGYPKKPLKGQKLGQLPAEDGIFVDCANVTGPAADLAGSGGRILMVRAEAADLKEAQEHVYAYLAKLDIPQTFYRRDIGYRATGKRF